MTPTPRYPAALHLKVTRAVDQVVRDICAQHPQLEDRSMEVEFLHVTHPRPTGALPFLIDEGDVQPIAAHGVEEVDDGA